MDANGSVLRRSALLAPSALGLLLGITAIALGGEPKVAPRPDSGASDNEQAALIAQLKARNAKWVQDFVDQRRDPSALPVDELETYSPGAMTIDAARQQSVAVFEGTVARTTYIPNVDAMTRSLATLAVTQVAKGSLPATVQIEQTGGPAWSEDGGRLQQLEGDPLLLPGQHVILMVGRDLGNGIYRTVYGAGVYLVTADGVQAPVSNFFAKSVNGLSVDAALALLR